MALLVVCGGLLGPSAAADGRAVPDPATALDVAAPQHVAAPQALVPRLRSHPAAGRPVWVRVPGLGVGVPVVPVVAPGGVLVPPEDPWQLGWWQDGAVPGARRGTAVISGHTVSNGDGALDELHHLVTGDRIVVGTAGGRIGYRVTEVVHYAKAQLARVAGQVFGQRVPGRLVLVTCTDFDGREYLGNTLAFARPDPAPYR